MHSPRVRFSKPDLLPFLFSLSAAPFCLLSPAQHNPLLLPLAPHGALVALQPSQNAPNTLQPRAGAVCSHHQGLRGARAWQRAAALPGAAGPAVRHRHPPESNGEVRMQERKGDVRGACRVRPTVHPPPTPEDEVQCLASWTRRSAQPSSAGQPASRGTLTPRPKPPCPRSLPTLCGCPCRCGWRTGSLQAWARSGLRTPGLPPGSAGARAMPLPAPPALLPVAQLLTRAYAGGGGAEHFQLSRHPRIPDHPRTPPPLPPLPPARRPAPVDTETRQRPPALPHPAAPKDLKRERLLRTNILLA